MLSSSQKITLGVTRNHGRLRWSAQSHRVVAVRAGLRASLADCLLAVASYGRSQSNCRLLPWLPAWGPMVGCCTGDTRWRAGRVNGYGMLTVARADLPAEFLAAFRKSALVAWDIETSGLEWRVSRIGTCQLFAEGTGAAVVSIEADSKPQRLAALLEDKTVPKVFHHAPFDLRFMMHEWGARPAAVRCTKVASKLIDPDASNEEHSLQRMVARYLGVELRKGPVRTSDWTADRLTPEQIEYAAADVIHLPPLLRALNARLAQLGLDRLYDRCCDFLPVRAALELGGYPDVFAY